MKTIKVIAKDGTEWWYTWDEHSWIFSDKHIVIVCNEGNVTRLVLNLDLFAYLEVT